MPLVILTGGPLSGKTQIANVLLAFFRSYVQEQKLNLECRIIRDADYAPLDTDPNTLYASSALEKQQRGAMKAEVEKVLTKTCIVILDAMNYIKGQRYELYCIAKACRTPAITVYCACSSQQQETKNSTSTNGAGARQPVYSSAVHDALVLRYEAPDAANRWDQPLFTITNVADIPFDAICDALFKRKPPPPNQSTQVQPISTTDFIQVLDQTTKQIVDVVIKHQQQQGDVPRAELSISGTDVKLILKRKVSSAELARIRRQFLAYTKSRPVAELMKQNISTLFVEYVNQSIQQS